jgi:hypothetical protein
VNAHHVDPGEMNEPDHFDDFSLEGRLSGGEVPPALADLFADMRTAYMSIPLLVGAELGPRTFSPRPRIPLLAKVAAATAAVITAATGGLAVAGALPAPLQRAISHIGIGAPPQPSRPHGPHHPSPAAPNRKTLTPTTTQHEPSRTDGTERGAATVPSSAASGGPACHQRPACSSNTPTTIANVTTPTTSDSGDNNGQTNRSGDNTSSSSDNGDQNTSPTTAAATGDGNSQSSDTTIGDQPNNPAPGDNSVNNNSGTGN